MSTDQAGGVQGRDQAGEGPGGLGDVVELRRFTEAEGAEMTAAAAGGEGMLEGLKATTPLVERRVRARTVGSLREWVWPYASRTAATARVGI